MGIAQRIRKSRLLEKVKGDVVLAQRIGVQVERALQNFDQIDPALAGSGWSREVGEVLDDLRGAPRLLLQHRQLLPGDFVGLSILQKFAHAENAGQRVVEFMRYAPNH